MSECVMRMEMPKNCWDCPCLDDYGDYPMCEISGEQRGYNFPIREKRMPNCPIICQLPEGHGDLIDRDALIDMVKTEDIALYTCFDSDDAYYSVTDLITILMMQKEIIKAKRKVNASDAVAPTDTPTDTPTATAERSET